MWAENLHAVVLGRLSLVIPLRVGKNDGTGPPWYQWYQSQSRPHIPIRLLYTLYAYLAPFGHNTQRGRQSDRNRRTRHIVAFRLKSEQTYR